MLVFCQKCFASGCWPSLMSCVLQACRQWVLQMLDALPSAGVALETVRPTERQWKAILQDASAAVQMKETQMQLVSQYEQKSQTAEAALAKLKVDLRAACR